MENELVKRANEWMVDFADNRFPNTTPDEGVAAELLRDLLAENARNALVETSRCNRMANGGNAMNAISVYLNNTKQNQHNRRGYEYHIPNTNRRDAR